MTTTNTATYNRRYYLDNKSKILEERRDRYANDPFYRRRMKRLAQEAYKKRQAEKPRTMVRPGVLQTPDGSILYTIGMLSKAVGLSVHTLRKYHRQGVLPAPQFFDKRGWRLYTQKQIRLLAGLFKALKEKKITRTELTKHAKRGWDDVEG